MDHPNITNINKRGVHINGVDSDRTRHAPEIQERVSRSGSVLLGGTNYLSDATYLTRPRVCYVLFVVSRITVSLVHDSPLLKNTRVGQVVLDKWFPLSPDIYM